MHLCQDGLVGLPFSSVFFDDIITVVPCEADLVYLSILLHIDSRSVVCFN